VEYPNLHTQVFMLYFSIIHVPSDCPCWHRSTYFTKQSREIILQPLKLIQNSFNRLKHLFLDHNKMSLSFFAYVVFPFFHKRPTL